MLRVVDPVVRPALRSVVGVRRGGGAPLPAPTTINLTSAQFAAGFTGSISTTKNAARIYGRGALTLWAGMITGSEAKITATSDYGANASLIQVAIDGGAFSNAPNTGTLYTLFTGLPHASRFVEVRYGDAFSDTPYIMSSGNVLQVTGQPPSIAPVTNWANIGADSSTSFSNAAIAANLPTYTPLSSAGKGDTYGSAIANIKIKGAFNSLSVVLNGGLRKVGVSKNGQAPMFYQVDEESYHPVRVMRIPCDGSLSTYYVWDDGNWRPGGGHFAVAGDATRQDVGLQRRMDQYGDSITFGTGPGATPADVETMPVAASFGMVGSTYGIAGYTIAQCVGLLDTVLPTKTVTSSDVAILAIGRNNVPTITAQDEIDYATCINKLLTKGYGKVLCRAILPTPDGSSSWVSENAALQAVVTAKANPNVIWIPTNTWLGYSSVDNTHPTAAGYVTLAGYAVPAYSAVL